MSASRFRTLEAWLQWQETLHVTEIDLGLERVRRVADAMNLPRPAQTVITVAGTNGKGSSVAMLDAILRSAGMRVGAYTSPHLHRYNERIQIDGMPVSDEEICAAFEQIEAVRNDVPLTYFEFGTLCALLVLGQREPDVAILEVGLGGRLDAVNIIDADVALITSIGIDHVEFLGGTRDKIAVEKAGILRAGRSAVCSDNDVPSTLRQYALSLPTDVAFLGEDYRFDVDDDCWHWWNHDVERLNLPKPALRGAYQLRNAAGVLQVIESVADRFNIDDEHIRDGLRSIRLQGRFQRFCGAVDTIVDVAHNPQAAEALIQTVKSLPAAGRTHVVLGMLRGKDHDGVINKLSEVADVWHLATLEGRRGASYSELEQAVRRQRPTEARPRIRTYEDVPAAYSGALESMKPGDRVIAAGSFLVASAVLAAIEEPNEALAGGMV